MAKKAKDKNCQGKDIKSGMVDVQPGGIAASAKFPSQAELNHHTVEDHKYTFCVLIGLARRYSHQKLLDKHLLHHKDSWFMYSVWSKEFHHKYQLDSHLNMHDLDKVFVCAYPCCNHVYKSYGEYNRHSKPHCGKYVEFTCSEYGKKFLEKKTLISIWNFAVIS